MVGTLTKEQEKAVELLLVFVAGSLFELFLGLFLVGDHVAGPIGKNRPGLFLGLL